MNTPPQRQLILSTCVAALGGLLFGYDTAVIAGAIGFIQSHFNLDAAETGWAASCVLAGCAAGAVAAGMGGDRIGRRKILLGSAGFFLVSAVGTALAPSFWWFVIYRTLGGLGIGAASMASPLYIAEVAPAHVRGRLVGVNTLAIVSGQLLVYIVNYLIARTGTEQWNSTSGWRWMFASGALPSLLLLGLLFVVAETPRCLAAQGKTKEALRVATSICGPAAAEAEMAAIAAEIRAESAEPLRLFHPPMRRLTGIGIVLACLQQVTGINVFLYYAPQIFQRFGFAAINALGQTITVGAVNLCFAIVAMFLVDRTGRRPLMFIGAAGMGLCLAGMGAIFWSQTGGYLPVFLLLGYIAFFEISVGPVTWLLLSELFPLRLRARALGVATVALWLADFVVSQTFPMLDRSPRLIAIFHHGFPFFFYAAFCAVEIVFVWRLIPETKSRTLEEIGRSLLRRTNAAPTPAL